MNAQEKFENVEDMFKEAEDTFRKGVGTLTNWSEQARNLIENQPSVILAAVGVSGFITGALLRHGFTARKALRSGQANTANTLPGFSDRGLPADPIILFGAGILAGVLTGPRIIQEAIASLDRMSQQSGDNLINFETNRPRTANAGNEKPFEKI